MTENNSRYEEFRVSGDELIGRVRSILRDGNASRLYLKNDDGETLLEIPLTAGVVAVTAGVVFLPAVAAVGAIAAVVTHVTIGVEHPDPGNVHSDTTA